MKRIDHYTPGWQGYELIDSGCGRKLERFGAVVLDRPDPEALWQRSIPEAWADAHASFSWKGTGGRWLEKKPFPAPWTVRYKEHAFVLGLNNFKHVGIFPEHQPLWEEVVSLCEGKPGIRVLNLFGYSGVASVVATSAGAKVTHLDASKQAIASVKANLRESNQSEDAVRLVCDDALRYLKRLATRGETFQIIILDPPAFGRGPKGEVWKIESGIEPLLALLPRVLAPDACAVFLHGYANGYSARTFGELLKDVLPESGNINYGDIGLIQKNGNRSLTTGVYSNWKKT